MKLQFDPKQQFQIDAMNAVADLFDGQPKDAPEFSVITFKDGEGLFSGQERTELGAGNRLVLDAEKLRENARAVQLRNDIEVPDPVAPLEAWELFDRPANAKRICPHFSVEMETGTGKTYVYLRTIFELSRRYGLKKFAIVVPSVAIREGVLKNIEITGDHFRALFDNMPFEHFVYDGAKVNRLRQFAAANTLQIMIINIDAFRKNFVGTEDEKKSNLMYRDSDKLSGHQPIEFVEAARPIVIIDEPQSVDSTEKSQEAIKALNPLCTLRYSATHRNPYNLVYRLDPVRAFELKLVKRIVVGNARGDGGVNAPFIRVEEITHKPSIKAKLRINVQGPDGVKQKLVSCKIRTDLSTASGERQEYAQGWEIAEIDANPEAGFVRFSNGTMLRRGDEIGGMRDDIWRVQIRKTIAQHLEKEMQLHNRGVKVLSLFFIDRVANYRATDGTKGKIALMFEQELLAALKNPSYRVLAWTKEPLDSLHDGYFAQDRKGSWKDSRENSSTQADDEAYELIMRKKELLLSIETPLRFIFSHSALREGWDNPNVFQICTLNETQSAVKKRQEIGRGLRLPVDSNGNRVFDDSINRLYVAANEYYEDFARSLQQEYEEDCGVTFGKVPVTAIARLTRVVDGKEQPIGIEAADAIQAALIGQKMLDPENRIGKAFQPQRLDFALNLPEAYSDLGPAVVDLLSEYQMERRVQRERDERQNKLRKEVLATPEFQALWERIKPKTTYRVEFESEALINRAVHALQHMPKVEAPKITYTTGTVDPTRAGVQASAQSASTEKLTLGFGGMPDILAYLQNETELTRSTLFAILKGSGRLGELFINPQRFLDQAAVELKAVLHRLLVDGIKYERVEGTGSEAEWEMLLFKDEELINFLSAEQVNKSVYPYVAYESDTERKFAQRLDSREDIKLFVKLPRWFHVETPVGTYNPDWAIVKHDDQTIYLVRETKSTKDFLKLRTKEADKVKCGQRHFEALGVNFAVAVSADEV